MVNENETVKTFDCNELRKSTSDMLLVACRIADNIWDICNGLKAGKTLVVSDFGANREMTLRIRKDSDFKEPSEEEDEPEYNDVTVAAYKNNTFVQYSNEVEVDTQLPIALYNLYRTGLLDCSIACRPSEFKALGC